MPTTTTENGSSSTTTGAAQLTAGLADAPATPNAKGHPDEDDRMSGPPVASVPPHGYGTEQWETDLAPFMDLARKRNPDDPRAWADEYRRRASDVADLRALGLCATCGRPIVLRQVGRCVYSEPCGHYRAQGDLSRMQPFIAQRLSRITPDRKAALLAILPMQHKVKP